MSEYTVAEVTPETAPLIPPLLYRGFGYTYTDGSMYEPAAILASLQGGRLFHFVGLDGTGHARGLLSLRFRYPATHLAELGALLVDPGIPGPARGQFLRLLTGAVVEKSRKLAHELGLRALISQEVTVHTLTQRLVDQLDFFTTGILLGWTPAWAERLRLLPEERTRAPSQGTEARASMRLNHRRTETVSVRPLLKLCKPYTVTLPQHFEGVLKLLYERMRLPVSFAPPSTPQGESTVACELDLRRGLAVVELLHVGTDAAEVLLKHLAHYRDGMVDLIHIVLPLSGPDLERTLDALLETGCRYGALLPFYRGHDVLLLQYLNNVEVEFLETDLYAPEARMLFRDVIGPVGGRRASAREHLP